MKLSLCFEGYVTANIEFVYKGDTDEIIWITEENKWEVFDKLKDGTYSIASLSQMLDDGEASFDLSDYRLVQ